MPDGGDIRPHFNGLITEKQLELAARIASEKGIATEEYLRRVLDEQFEKLEHAERCKPRTRKQHTGRPLDNTEKTRVGELAKSLRGVYARLRGHHGDGYAALFGEQEETVNTAIEAKDVETLERIERERPWILRKWEKRDLQQSAVPESVQEQTKAPLSREGKSPRTPPE